MGRPAAVAGRFYPARPRELTRDLERCLESSGPPEAALGCVVPHAALMYSGHVAGAVYGRLELPPVAILLCPNHAGVGRPLAILSEDDWETPLGPVAAEPALAATLKKACPALEEDVEAHQFEHSLEVQLPFLQHLRPGLRIVPIALSVGRYEPLEELGEAIASVVTGTVPRPLLVASTDLNHYEPERVGRIKDRKAIEAILALDPQGLYDTVRRERISMCGYEPTTVVLTAVRALGAKEGELIRYATSGDITGDRGSVVGYAGIVIR